MTIPRRSLVTFSVTSALASSISSRTSSEARSLISWTVWARSCVGLSVAKAPEDHGGQQATGECCGDDELGALVGELRHRLLPGRRRAGGCVAAWPDAKASPLSPSVVTGAGPGPGVTTEIGCSATGNGIPAALRRGLVLMDGQRLGRLVGGDLVGLALDDRLGMQERQLLAGRRSREPPARDRPADLCSGTGGGLRERLRGRGCDGVVSRRMRTDRTRLVAPDAPAASLSLRLPNFIRAGLPRRCAAKSSRRPCWWRSRRARRDRPAGRTR